MATRLTIRGKVQGVNYRDFVRREAQKLGVNGYVRNMQDGSVEVVTDVSGEELEKLKKVLRKGTIFSFVASISEEEVAIDDELEGFDIHYS